MEVTRKMTIDTEMFEVGDTIEFTLTSGEKVQALVVRNTDDGTLFITVDCVGSEQPMFKNPDSMGSMEISYYNSDLRHYLKNELLPLFPEEIKSRMVGMKIEAGEYDLLRIPTEMEIFGENEYGMADDGKRFAGMEKRRNRITFKHTDNEDWQWYWLQNRHKKYASRFALVGSIGYAGYYNASYSLGVRPVFLLS